MRSLGRVGGPEALYSGLGTVVRPEGEGLRFSWWDRHCYTKSCQHSTRYDGKLKHAPLCGQHNED